MNRRFVLGLFLSLLSLSLVAQPMRDAVTIEVVDVPVFVVRDGESVRGLRGEDFELFVNGKRQSIDFFDEIGAAESQPGSLRERRLFLLMFDLAFSQPPALNRAQKAAAKLLTTASPGDLFSIATYSWRRGVWFVTPFTSDQVALARAIGSLSDSGSGDPLSLVLTTAERQSMTAAWRGYLTDDRPSDALDRISGEALRDVFRAEHLRAVEHQMRDLEKLGERLGTLQGQKHVILLSEGYDAEPRDYVATPAASAGRDSFDMVTTRVSNFGWNYGTLSRHLRAMRESFAGHDVLLHALDLRGVVSPMISDALLTLTDETGGRYVNNRNDLGRALVDLTESLGHGYVLGFKPSNARAKHNSIEVKVKGQPRNTLVRHRQGFSGTPSQLDVHEGLYLADVVMNDVPQTGTAPSLAKSEHGLEVRVPLRPLSAQLGAAGKAELFVYLFGANNVPIGFQKISVEVPADATGEKTLVVRLPEGAEVAKALLRVDDSLGFSRTDV
ncbi:MAG TPA: VWA domain-containing protein [Thermoanaerobaculia bacterium]|nr:VWA domain-containing protein [Thermoanaerobaculia bacterium]